MPSFRAFIDLSREGRKERNRVFKAYGLTSNHLPQSVVTYSLSISSPILIRSPCMRDGRFGQWYSRHWRMYPLGLRIRELFTELGRCEMELRKVLDSLAVSLFTWAFPFVHDVWVLEALQKHLRRSEQLSWVLSAFLDAQSSM